MKKPHLVTKIKKMSKTCFGTRGYPFLRKNQLQVVSKNIYI